MRKHLVIWPFWPCSIYCITPLWQLRNKTAWTNTNMIALVLYIIKSSHLIPTFNHSIIQHSNNVAVDHNVSHWLCRTIAHWIYRLLICYRLSACSWGSCTLRLDNKICVWVMVIMSTIQVSKNQHKNEGKDFERDCQNLKSWVYINL